MTRARDLARYNDFSGTELILDADGDTSITADTDDTIHVKIAGSDKFTLDPSGNMTISGTLPAGSLTGNVSSSLLSGALPAISGASLTGVAIHTALSAAAEGYVTLNNGVIIQWGGAGSVANGGATTITFPLSFPTACWKVVACWTVNTSGTHHSAFPTTSQANFTAHNVSGASQGVMYMAVGN